MGTHVLPARSGRGIGPSMGVLALLALAAAGCGDGADPDRRAVSGRITLDGQPLAAGSITFLPSGAGSATGGPIEAGSFTIPRADGPTPGRYRVEVVAALPTGRLVPNPDLPGSTVEEVVDVVPGRYNRDSELSAEVTTDGDNSFQFDLSSRP